MTSRPTVLPETHYGPHHIAAIDEHAGSGELPTARASAEPLPLALAAALRLDRRVWLGGGAVAGVGALLAIGVPASSLIPFAAVGACLGMHLFMGHGGHGGHDGHDASSSDRPDRATHEGH